MYEPITLVIDNIRTWIFHCPHQALEEIDKATSFVRPVLEGMGLKPVRYNFVDSDFAWDGWVRFLDKGKVPSVPSGLRDIVMFKLQELGMFFRVVDERKAPELEPSSYPPIPLWPHQEEAKKQMIAQPDCVARMPPRAGKTRCMLEVVRELNLRCLWIAPTTSIVDQTIRSAREWFDEKDVVQVQTKTWKEHKDALITVVTAAGMLQLPPEFFLSRQMLVCDEIHHFLENGSWGRKLAANTAHIHHRKGMSGTFFRSSGDDLALLAFIGRVGYSIGSQELLDKGYLVPTYQCFVPIEGKVKKTSGEFFAPNGVGTLGISKHAHRNDVVASAAKHLEGLGRTVLILVTTKVQGYEIKERLDGFFTKNPNAEFEAVEFASTDRKKGIIQKLYKSFSERQEVKILIGTSMVGEGVDLPPADALVYAAGRKASVPFIQSLYRVATANPGKEFGIIVDFVDKHHKTLLQHSRHRWTIASSDPVFKLSYLESLEQFPEWAANAKTGKK